MNILNRTGYLFPSYTKFNSIKYNNLLFYSLYIFYRILYYVNSFVR